MSTFHADTVRMIEQLQLNGSQSLLISGPKGIGLLDIALAITSGSETTIVAPDNTKASRPIATETMRQLYEATRSKSVGKQYIVIDEADAMTHGAQGAFLKLLEEPNPAIYFILVSSRPDILLSTILSRVHHRSVQPVTTAQSEQILTDLGVTDAKVRQQLLYIADGLPEELSRLATDEAYFNDAVRQMKDARELLQAPLYERLVLINSYRDNRIKAQQLLQFAMSMTRRSLSEHPHKTLIVQLERLLEASGALAANANVRLTLTRLVL